MGAILQGSTLFSMATMLLIKATLVLGSGWLLHRMLDGRNPRWRVLAWRVAMLGLIALPLFEALPSAWHLNLAPRGGSLAGMLPLPRQSLDRGIEAPRSSVTPNLDLARTPSAANIVRADLPRPSAFWPGTAVSLWLLVVSALMLRHLGARHRLRRLIQSGAGAPAWLQTLARQLADELGSSAVDLRLVDAMVSPFVAGWWRPVVVIPAKLAEPGRNRADLRMILAHELAHVRSRDLVWLAMARILAALLWFHPLIWILERAHSAACEEVSDGVAAQQAGGVVAYTQTLAGLFLELVVDAPRASGYPMLMRAEITRRIRRLRRGIQMGALSHRRRALLCISASVALALLGGLRFSSAHAESPAAAAVPPATPGEIAGWVVDGEGHPVSGIDVSLGTPGHPVVIKNGSLADPQYRNAFTVKTDARGRFAFNSEAPQFCLVVAGDRGVALCTDAELPAARQIRLWPWARISGKLMAGSAPAPDRPMTVSHQSTRNQSHQVQFFYDTRTDKQGNFEWDRVIPGVNFVGDEFNVQFTQRGDRDSMLGSHLHSTLALLAPGEHASLTIGGTGRDLKGRLALPDGLTRSVDWSQNVSFDLTPVTPVPIPALLQRFSSQAWLSSFAVDEPMLYSLAIPVNGDGSFHAGEIPFGEYNLTVRAYEPNDSDMFGTLVAMLRRKVSIAPPSDAGRAPALDLGELRLGKFEK